jgi:hypothetical protein
MFVARLLTAAFGVTQSHVRKGVRAPVVLRPASADLAILGCLGGWFNCLLDVLLDFRQQPSLILGV